MLKIRDSVDLKELEKFGFKTFMSGDETYLIAVRDSVDDKCRIGQYYRVGIDSKTRIFDKSKYRGYGKCLLRLAVKKSDIQDLIQAGLVEKVEE